MKNETLYNKTVDILVQAYFNDTLTQGNCQACAVGNIVAARKGIILKRDGDFIRSSAAYEQNTEWYNSVSWNGYPLVGMYVNESKEQIDITGYTLEQVAMIEKSFEGSKKCFLEEDRMFNGLMAVIDVLDKIHENTDTAATHSVKQRFVKA